MFNLPNLFTLANLLCGCLAIHSVYHQDVKMLLIFFGLSLLFDLLDGLVARALKQTSPLGAELDSLADMISFGLLPGVILFHLIDFHSRFDATTLQPFDLTVYLPILGFVFTAAAALRLAKFNLDERQTEDFMGLNTPAATIAIVGVYINAGSACTTLASMFSVSHVSILAFSVVIGTLLLVDLPMLSFKIDRKNARRISYQAVLVVGGIIILLLMQTCALPFLILWYILFSIIRLFIEKNRS